LHQESVNSFLINNFLYCLTGLPSKLFRVNLSAYQVLQRISSK